MVKREKTVLRIEALFERAKEERRKFLLKNEWKYGCNYPDACWRWSKIFAGERICLSEDAAFFMERNL